MVMDLAAPIRAVTSSSPTRVLRLAMVVGAAGLIALVAAVGVLVWTYTGAKNSNQQTVPADISAAPQAIVPSTAKPSPALPAPAPPPAPAQAAGLPPGLEGVTPAGDAGMPQNPGLAALAPTGSAPRQISTPGPSVDLPTVKWPTNGNWLPEIANNVDWGRVFWSSPSGGSATNAIIGAATSTANNAVNLIGNSAVDVFNTLLLINSGYYGDRGGSGLLPAPADALSTLAKLSLPAPPSLDLTKLPPPPSLDLTKLPPPPNFGPPQLPPPPSLDLTKLPPPPKVGLPKPPKLPSITKMIGLPF